MEKKPMFSIIVATDLHNGIGKNGTIPWDLPKDLKFFRIFTEVVTNPSKINAVIMGYKSWLSIPEENRPFPKRINIVLSRHQRTITGMNVEVMDDFSEALIRCFGDPNIETTFIIGGGTIYQQAIVHPNLQTIYQTRIGCEFECDTFFPPIDERLFHIAVRKKDKDRDRNSDQTCSLEFVQWEKL